MTDIKAMPTDIALMMHTLRVTPWFAHWPDSSMSQLLADSRLERYGRGEIISDERDAPETFVIASGYAIVGYIPPGWDRSPVALLGPGSVCGFTRADNNEGRAVYDFCAHTDMVVVKMSTLALRKILDANPVLWGDMAKMLMRQHREILDSLLGQSIGSLSRRVATTIERLTALYGSRNGQSVSLRLRLTQEELAALLQVTRQSVNKELARLVTSGTISVVQNKITILDSTALRQSGCG
jgi:CRP/FNR family cyclic AMP-dependent transcriptional regulator